MSIISRITVSFRPNTPHSFYGWDFAALLKANGFKVSGWTKWGRVVRSDEACQCSCEINVNGVWVKITERDDPHALEGITAGNYLSGNSLFLHVEASRNDTRKEYVKIIEAMEEVATRINDALEKEERRRSAVQTAIQPVKAQITP